MKKWLNDAREWWDAATFEERQYAALIAISLIGLAGSVLAPSETRMRVKLEQ